MPIWGTYFLLKLNHQQFYINDFVKHGEFALYAAAFLAPALQQVVTNIRDAKYVLGTGSVLFALAGLMLAVIMYSGVVVGDPKRIDEAFLFKWSIVLFVCSLAFAVLVTLIEKQVANPNVEKSEADEQHALNKKFSAKLPEAAAGIRDLSAQREESKAIPESELASRFRTENDMIDSNPEGHDG